MICFSFIGLMIVSCQEKKSGKLKDLENIRAKSTYQQKEKNTIKENWKDSLLAIYNQDSVDFKFQSIESDSNRCFFHEFNYLESSMWSLRDSNNHTFQHQFARFKIDSILVKNNFFNWFDQEFCQRNQAVRIYSRLTIFPKQIFFICTNQSIHVVKSDFKIDLMKWIKLIQFTEKKVKFIYICHQAKNKKALWYTFNQNKLNLIPAQ